MKLKLYCIALFKTRDEIRKKSLLINTFISLKIFRVRDDVMYVCSCRKNEGGIRIGKFMKNDAFVMENIFF